MQKMNPIHEKGGGIPPAILSDGLSSLLLPAGEPAATPTKDENNPAYDAGYKKQFANKTEFLHFLNKYVKAPWASLLRPEDIELCDKEFFLEDCRKREADLVYRIRFRKDPGETYPDPPRETVIYCYLIMELQSSVDFTMPLRFLTYVFALLLRILDVLEERIMQLPEDNQISLWDWMEHVLMAICNDKTKDQIQHLFKKKGARNEMIHGLQELILNERREGYLEGICQGISQGGIQTLIQDNIEIGISKTTILEKLQRRFSISPEEAEENYRRFSTGS